MKSIGNGPRSDQKWTLLFLACVL